MDGVRRRAEEELEGMVLLGVVLVVVVVSGHGMNCPSLPGWW